MDFKKKIKNELEEVYINKEWKGDPFDDNTLYLKNNSFDSVNIEDYL